MPGDYSCSQITQICREGQMIDCSPGDRVRQFTPPPNISLLPLCPSNGNIPFESVCLGILWITRTTFCFQANGVFNFCFTSE